MALTVEGTVPGRSAQARNERDTAPPPYLSLLYGAHLNRNRDRPLRWLLCLADRQAPALTSRRTHKGPIASPSSSSPTHKGRGAKEVSRSHSSSRGLDPIVSGPPAWWCFRTRRVTRTHVLQTVRHSPLILGTPSWIRAARSTIALKASFSPSCMPLGVIARS